MAESPEVLPRLEMILRLPQGVTVHPEMLGGTFETRIARRRVCLTLPRFRWNGAQERYFVVPPRLRAVRRDVRWSDYLDDAWAWGSVVGWRAGERHRINEVVVTHMLVTASLRRGERPGRVAERANAIAQGARDWWSHVRDWIQVVTHQSLEEQRTDDDSLIPNTRAWQWDGETGRHVPIQERHVIRMQAVEQLRARTFQAILNSAEAHESPPSMHLLLRNARHARWEGQTRQTVLDAATAAELALTELLDDRLSDAPADVVEIVRRGTQGLLRLRNALVNLGENRLPNSMQRGLIEVRNSAIHRGEEPSDAEAGTALTLATDLVELVAPRRGLL
jgi:hypothetical protein